jgi:hypothetical protein
MIRIFYFVVAFTTLSACNKERTCSCSDGYKMTIKATKNTAQDACDKYSTPGVECKID